MINYILKYQYLPSTNVTTMVHAIYGHPFSQKNMVLNNVEGGLEMEEYLFWKYKGGIIDRWS